MFDVGGVLKATFVPYLLITQSLYRLHGRGSRNRALLRIRQHACGTPELWYFMGRYRWLCDCRSVEGSPAHSEHDGIDWPRLTDLTTCSAIQVFREAGTAGKYHGLQNGWPVFLALYYSRQAAASFQYVLHAVLGTPPRASASSVIALRGSR